MKFIKALLIALVIVLGLIGSGLLYIKHYERRLNKEGTFRLAVKDKDFAIIEQLLKEGVNIDAQNPKSGDNALMYAIRDSDLEMVKYLLNHGAKSAGVGTPLDYAVFILIGTPLGTTSSKIKKIIHYLVNLKIPNKEQPSILTAIIVGNLDAVKQWLNFETIKKLSMEEFRDVLHAAKLSSDTHMLNFLKQEIAKFHDLDPEKQALLIATMKSS